MCSYPSKRALLGLLVLGLSGTASAEEVDASAMTRLSGRQDPRDGTVHTVVPAYEDIWISASDLKLPSVDGTKVVVSAWGLVAGGDPRDGDNVTGDVDLAYVEGRLLDRHVGVRLGRQILASGVARNLQLDGLSLGVRGGPGLGVEAYGGIPVTPRFGYAKGQGAFGGRLYWRPAAIFEGGVSFVDVIMDGRVDRQEAGVDARLWLSKQLTLSGLAALSTVESRLAEATVRAMWQPAQTFEIGVEGSRTAPDLFVSRGSIFSVFAEESRDELGGTIYWRPMPRLRIWGDGYALHYDQSESGISDEVGGRGDLRLAVSLERDNATTVGIEGSVLYVPSNGYARGRAFAAKRFGKKITATVDLDYYVLRDLVNGQDKSFTGAATLGWDFAPGWRGVVTGVAGVTPFLESRFEGLAKVVYNMDYRVKEVAK